MPSETPIVEADLRVGESDFVEAFVAQGQKSSRALQKLLGIALVLTLAIVALSWPVSLGVWVLMIPVAIAGLFLAPRQPRFLARRAFLLRPRAWNEVRLTLDEQHLTVRSDKLESYRPWSQIDGWLETPRLFVLVAGTTVSDIWPKAAFSADDAVRLRELLDRKLVLEKGPAQAARTTKVASRTRVVLWVILLLLLLAAYAMWRSTQ